MDEHTFRVLEFSKVLEMASSYSITSPGKSALKSLRPIGDIEMVCRQLDLVSEYRRLLSTGQPPGIEHFDDLIPLFHRLRPASPLLEPLELRAFLPLFSSAINLKRLTDNPSIPRLREILSGLHTHPDLKVALELSIDREGRIKDEASPDLYHIRESIKFAERRIKGMLTALLSRRDLSPHIQDNYITERNGRWVIPLKRDSKGHIPGVIHDISKTGETIFIEPHETQHLGNELEALRAEEKVEEFRVLCRLSSLLRERLNEIELDYQHVLTLDMLQAISAFSESMKMSSPVIGRRDYIRILRGLHPVLWKTLRRDNRERELVPLDFELGREAKCMVITGSNTGGKTVALKTVGVLHLMALSGMHIPADSGTAIPFFNKVLADIGDEQSIEQNLSTFSAHITRLSDIVRESGSDTLIIIDELGTGTDPDEGGALSCAVLRELKRRGALTVVSTHLGTLKAFAYSEEGVINGAMEMEEVRTDGMTLCRPTYRLVMGESGRSHAFDIAERLGMPKAVIEEARNLIEGEGINIESLISELRQKREGLEESHKEAEQIRKDLYSLRASLKEELSRTRTERKEAILNALREAEDIIRKTKREARDIVEKLKDSDSPKLVIEGIKELDSRLSELGKARRSLSPSDETAGELKEVRKGQTVFIRTIGENGVVHSINKKSGRCRITVTGRELEVPLSELSEPRPGREEAEEARPRRTGRPVEQETEVNGVPSDLNLVGQRVDPALSVLERYLNDASISGLKSIRVTHGIGTGRLSSAIRNHLKDHPLVSSFRKGSEDEGGEAVTVVSL